MPDGTHVEKPVCVSVIACESVIVNAASGNKSMIESFTHLFADTFPTHATRLTIVASVTNIVGQAMIGVKVTAPTQGQIFGAEGPIEAPSPLDVFDLVFDLQGIELPEQGAYHIDVFAGTEHLVGRPFILNPMAQPTA